jgi:hypothetical protein
MITVADCKNRAGAHFFGRPMANFSIRVFFMALAISFAVVSCGKDDDGKDGDEGGNDTALTAANWQKTVRDVYGFDLTVPSGWTFKQGKKENINPAYSVQFTTTAADFQAAYLAFMQHVFDLTEKVTPATGNYDGEGKLDEIPVMMGSIYFPLWIFDTAKYAVMIDLSDAEATKTAQINLIATRTF